MNDIPTLRPYLSRGLSILCIAGHRAWLESPGQVHRHEGESEIHVFSVDLKRECERFAEIVEAGNEFSTSRLATMAGVSAKTIQSWEGTVLAGAKRVGGNRRFSRVDLFCAWLVGGLKRAGLRSPRAFGVVCLFIAGLDRQPDQPPARKSKTATANA
jgi:hypothetical protein